MYILHDLWPTRMSQCVIVIDLGETVMDSLFAEYEPKRFEPLAVRLRPTSLDHFSDRKKPWGRAAFCEP